MLTESSVIDNLTVMENGVILIKTANRVFRDGLEISKTYSRSSVEPGQDVSAMDARIIAIAAAVWTQQVIDDYAAASQP